MSGDPDLERLARPEHASRLLAWLAAKLGDVQAAEDALAEAFARAVPAWRRERPASPEGWLLKVAWRVAIDASRRARTRAGTRDALAVIAATRVEPVELDEIVEIVDDKRLELLFVCAHPAVAENVRVPLVLQVVVGVEAARIASLHLVSPATLAQRLVRAKRRIAEAGIPFERPPPSEIDVRAAHVLDAIYSAFTLGRMGAAPDDALAAELREGGATVDTAGVDATDATAVSDWLDEVVATAGRVDTVFNGIGARPEALAYPADALAQDVDAFLRPYRHVLASQFLTAREAIRRMPDGDGGNVVMLSATLSGMAAPHMANLSGTCGAIEATSRALAGEFGGRGIRINCLRASAMPETRTIRETAAGQAALRGGPPDFGVPPLGRPVTVADTAAVAAFLASDHAGGMTAQTVTVCAGQFPG